MNKILLAILAGAPTKQEDIPWWQEVLDFFSFIFFLLLKTLGYIAAAYLAWLLLKWVFSLFTKTNDKQSDRLDLDIPPVQNQAPRAGLTEQTQQTKQKSNNLHLDSVNVPIAKPSTTTSSPAALAASAQATSTPSPSPTMPDPNPTAPTSVGPGDFEKSLAHAGQRMDSLLAQTVELTRQLKLSEKAKTDATIELNKAVGELKSQLLVKDEQIAKLEGTLDLKSTYPSLRALVEIKKLCTDMIGTQKPLAHDDLIAFVTGAIDGQLEKLDVLAIEYPAGTPLEKIPGDQVENSARHEATDDPDKHNRVARLVRPCYYFERDSKRIIIAKAVVVLYRLTPPSKPLDTAPQTPNA